MKQPDPSRAKELFPGSDIVRKYTFKSMHTRDDYALLAKANHLISHGFTIGGVGSAHLSDDCFECLSPHRSAA